MTNATNSPITIQTPKIEYCLYARKSSESDERQAMSIDSQIKEMTDLATREQITIAEIRQESHSAKASLARPVFNQMLTDIEQGLFSGILTWAPDRLSRNAGDLGRLVDLMDQGKLHTIRTYSQIFGNNPNEKFLLMILCSQAKLENDNRGINVKRGLKAKCEMGWRPGVAPIGYKNILTNNRISQIVLDEERAPFIKQMFNRVGEQGQSGRTIKKWLDTIEFRTKNDKAIPLSKIYAALNSRFYYGDFEYHNIIYKGRHPALITKALWERVQRQLIIPPKKWHQKTFPFKTLCKCGTCGASVTGEERYKKLKYGGFNKHIYYHCTRSIDFDCDEPYITEADLIQQLIAYLDDIKINELELAHRLKHNIDQFHKLRSDVLKQEYLNGNLQEIDYAAFNKITKEMVKRYLLHTLQFGSAEERQEILSVIKTKFILHNRQLRIK